jgi:hypothetical protein
VRIGAAIIAIRSPVAIDRGDEGDSGLVTT